MAKIYKKLARFGKLCAFHKHFTNKIATKVLMFLGEPSKKKTSWDALLLPFKLMRTEGGNGKKIAEN